MARSVGPCNCQSRDHVNIKINLLGRVLARRTCDASRGSPLWCTSREATLLKCQHSLDIAITFPKSIILLIVHRRCTCAVIHLDSLPYRHYSWTWRWWSPVAVRRYFSGWWALVVEIVIVVVARRRCSSTWTRSIHWHALWWAHATTTAIPSWWWRAAHTTSWGTISATSGTTVRTSSWASSASIRASSSRWSAWWTVHHHRVVGHGRNGVPVLINGLSTPRGSALWWSHSVRAITATADCLERRVSLVERCHVLWRILLAKIKGRVIVAMLSRHDGVARERWGRFGLWELSRDSCGIGTVGVVCLPVHVLVLGNALLPRLATDQRAPHCTRHNAARDDDYGGPKNNPSSPGHVWNEQ